MIGFVRHGQTAWNAQGIIQGQTDIPLNEEGVEQAKRLAARLESEETIWEAVLTSDLQRALETGRIVSERLRVPLLAPDGRLRERSFGEIEGTTEAERLTRWGADWRKLNLGAESDASMRARGKELIDELTARAPERNVLIVSHGSFIAQMLQELCSGLQDSRLGNLSYSILERREDGWHPLLHNCSKHLD